VTSLFAEMVAVQKRLLARHSTRDVRQITRDVVTLMMTAHTNSRYELRTRRALWITMTIVRDGMSTLVNPSARFRTIGRSSAAVDRRR